MRRGHTAGVQTLQHSPELQVWTVIPTPRSRVWRLGSLSAVAGGPFAQMGKPSDQGQRPGMGRNSSPQHLCVAPGQALHVGTAVAPATHPVLCKITTTCVRTYHCFAFSRVGLALQRFEGLSQSPMEAAAPRPWQLTHSQGDPASPETVLHEAATMTVHTESSSSVFCDKTGSTQGPLL